MAVVCPSVHLSVTLVIHASAIQHIETPFAPYDRAMLDALSLSLCGELSFLFQLSFDVFYYNVLTNVIDIMHTSTSTATHTGLQQQVRDTMVAKQDWRLPCSRNYLDTVSYTHLTLPTIYSV